jgi:hypothetical protein
MRKAVPLLIAAVAVAVMLLAVSGRLSVAEEPTPVPTEEPTPMPWPYIMYFPVIFRNAMLYRTEVLTIPVGWMYAPPGSNNVIYALSFGHTHGDAYDPSGSHVCVACERSEWVLADMVYEADYGTWYYIGRSFVSVPIPDVRIITAALRVDLCTYGYQYSGQAPALRLNAGTWPDSAFPDDWRVLWGSWDPGRVLAEYTPTVMAEGCLYGPREQIVLPLSGVEPGRTLKFVWRLRDDDRNLVNPDGNAPRLVRTGTTAWNNCFTDCTEKSYAVLEIGYIP